MQAREGRSVLASEIVAGASFFLFLPSLTRSLVLFRPPAPSQLSLNSAICRPQELL